MLRVARLHPFLAYACVWVCAVVLAACGGGSDKATIGGSVSGLASGQTVTLQNSNGDTVTVTANQSFSFPTSVGAGGAYDVSVLTQPAGETCTVTNGTGSVNALGDDVTNVAVSCSASSSVGGTLSGLAAGEGVWLTTNGETLALAANGAFAFPGVFPDGTAYNVTVTQQPTQQTCTVSSPSGTVASGVMASVTVTCQ